MVSQVEHGAEHSPKVVKINSVIPPVAAKKALCKTPTLSRNSKTPRETIRKNITFDEPEEQDQPFTIRVKRTTSYSNLGVRRKPLVKSTSTNYPVEEVQQKNLALAQHCIEYLVTNEGKLPI